jgi:hypothetical protein
MRSHILNILLVLAAMISAPAAAKENVLIIGGAGNTGSVVSKMLMKRGDDVTAFVRPSTDRVLLAGTNAQFVVGDAMSADDVAKALEGKKYTIMIEVVQILDVNDAQSYSKLYANFVPWAKKMGVKQFLGLGSGCGDREAKDCPLSKPLYKVAADQTIAEHILRNSGVPYTIIRVGALMPGNHNAPLAKMHTGTSYLTEDLTVFGAALRADLDDQIYGCVGAARCINKILVLEDPNMAAQKENWLCKRRLETDKIIVQDPRCGDIPPVKGATERVMP